MWSVEWLNSNASLIVNTLTGIVLAFTALQVYYYTRATARLADLTEREIKINIRPIIIVNNIHPSLRIKNIGKSPALNINVSDVIRKYDGENYIFKFTEKLECGVNEERGIPITPYYENNPVAASGDSDKIKLALLDCGSLAEGETYRIIIDYNDSEMGKWRSVTLVDNKGVHFKEVIDLNKKSMPMVEQAENQKGKKNNNKGVTMSITEEKQYEYISEHLEGINDKIIKTFEFFITLFIALSGGVLWLKASNFTNDFLNKLIIPVKWLICIIGSGAGIIIILYLFYWWENRKALAKFRAEPKIPNPKWKSFFIEIILLILILTLTIKGCCLVEPILTFPNAIVK